ncbi:unnamed protein product [Paramecium sonneborni]|uniref:Uncharacterized protein n=1 Tax=Paramecium sonneborni TaxID=65129 RepID=A0A8S1RPV9_9CILI|nr:unnamed protein product [Paramecium sonneborni]
MAKIIEVKACLEKQCQCNYNKTESLRRVDTNQIILIYRITLPLTQDILSVNQLNQQSQINCEISLQVPHSQTAKLKEIKVIKCQKIGMSHKRKPDTKNILKSQEEKYNPPLLQKYL